MTLDDLDTWRVIYSVFIGADLESDIHFALNNHPDAQIRKETANWRDLIDLEDGPMKRDLDLESTVYGV